MIEISVSLLIVAIAVTTAVIMQVTCLPPSETFKKVGQQNDGEHYSVKPKPFEILKRTKNKKVDEKPKQN